MGKFGCIACITIRVALIWNGQSAYQCIVGFLQTCYCRYTTHFPSLPGNRVSNRNRDKKADEPETDRPRSWVMMMMMISEPTFHWSRFISMAGILTLFSSFSHSKFHYALNCSSFIKKVHVYKAVRGIPRTFRFYFIILYFYIYIFLTFHIYLLNFNTVFFPLL